MKLSEHFNSSEFACHCGCGECAVSSELIVVLEDVRNHFNAPVKVMSGRRCSAHNKKVGGVPDSQHVLGTAADIQINGIQPSAVADYLESKYKNSHGVGRYKTFTHIDVRKNKARWARILL